VNPGMRLAVSLGAAGVAAIIAAWASFRYVRGRKTDALELERVRRLTVNRIGRITAGRIVDFVEPETPDCSSKLVLYKYEVSGVTYEAAQEVAALSDIASPARCLAGQTASVKYDPRKPTNSIVVCEEWCGLPGDKPAPGDGDSGLEELVPNDEL
jgi:hypothetical protein